MYQPSTFDEIYLAAREEHAWRLRAEKLTHREVGARLGVTHHRARQLSARFGCRIEYARRVRAADEIHPISS